MRKIDYVWYASYGSNINKDRFLCYIQGGNPKWSTKVEKGCRDKALPISEKSFIIHHQLYFSKEAAQWNGGGVCFIGLDFNKSFETYSYMYLIKRDQFLDVVSQENNIDHIHLDLNEVIENGAKKYRDSWYGNILYLDEVDDYPVFTFTTNEEFSLSNVRKPSLEYLITICVGLKREIGLTDEQIVDYFIRIPGIADKFTKEDIKQILD
jgi:hypothetical protein